MVENADIIVTATQNNKIIGVARAVTDFHYCCYLSDLAVDKSCQKSGVGKKLIEIVSNRDWREMQNYFIVCTSGNRVLSKNWI